MSIDSILQITREALLLTLLLTALPVAAAMIVGLIVSLFQAATQLQEQTLTVVPKIVAVFAVLGIGGLWMLRQAVLFARVVLENIVRVS